MASSEIAHEGLLTGRMALVTEADDQPGRAICVLLVEAGATVMAVCHDDRAATELAEALPAVRSIATDLCDPDRVEAMARQAEETLGRVDILVHACGDMATPAAMMMAEAEPDAMAEAVRRRLRPAFLCNRAVLPTMIRQGAGQIVNVIGPASDGFEASAQASVVGLTASLADEVKQYGIRVQAVTCEPTDEVAPERVADVACRLLTLPADVTLGRVSVSVTTVARRKRKRRAPREDATPSANAGDTNKASNGSETERFA